MDFECAPSSAVQYSLEVPWVITMWTTSIAVSDWTAMRWRLIFLCIIFKLATTGKHQKPAKIIPLLPFVSVAHTHNFVNFPFIKLMTNSLHLSTFFSYLFKRCHYFYECERVCWAVSQSTIYYSTHSTQSLVADKWCFVYWTVKVLQFSKPIWYHVIAITTIGYCEISFKYKPLCTVMLGLV